MRPIASESSSPEKSSTDDSVDDSSLLLNDRALAVVSNSPFELHYKNQQLVPPRNKVRLIMVCAMARIVPVFTLDSLTQPPYSSQNQHLLKPTIEIVTSEIKRRNPTAKRLSKMKLNDLIPVLAETNHFLTGDCREFIKQEFDNIKNGFQMEIE